MKGYRDDVSLPRREGQASREGCRRNIVPSWKERWSIRRFIVASSANPWRKGENKKRVNCPRDERTVFGRVAGARRRARRGEQKGRISSSRRRALFTLGEGLEQARQLSTTRPFALHPRHMAWPTFIIDAHSGRVKLFAAWSWERGVGLFPTSASTYRDSLSKFGWKVVSHPLLLTFATTRCSQSWA